METPTQPNPMPVSNDTVVKNDNPLTMTDRSIKRRAQRFHARLRRSVLPIVALLAVTLGLSARAGTISATLEPNEIAFGDSAQLIVTIQGQNADAPQIPAVNGLSFQPMGQSSQIQIINGVMTANVSHSYMVTPTQLGTFTIPAIKYGGAQSQPLALKVLKRTGAVAQGNPQSGALPAPAVNGTDDDTSVPDKNSFGFLRIVSPKKQFYVGEMVPVELKACFRAGVELRVDGLPKLNSDAFTMNKLSDQPARSQQIINGVRYTVFSWQTVITAVKAGEYDMTVEIPTTVTVRQRAQRPHIQNPFNDPFFDDAFNDPFFANFFGTASQKQVSLSSQPSGVKILSLPTENRPAGFAGAVGQFEFSAEAAPTQAAVGDPVTLKMKITGTGNFDRVNAPELGKNDSWKSYKPGAKFDAEDSAGYSGTKTFDQALVAERAGKLEIPALAFSFFNPETKQYVTRTSAPIAIEVAQGQGVASAPAATSTTIDAGAAKTAASPAAAAPEIVANKLSAGHFTSTLRPWFLNVWLMAGLVVAIVTLAVLNLIVRRRQTLASDPQRLFVANTRREVQAQIKIMESAVAQGAAVEFFAAARGAFQSALGLLWNVPPRAITLNEINSRMNGKAEGFRFIFELADEVTYTGRSFGPDDLRKWLRTVNVELKKLEAA
ncbi:MAG: BatD family protein [Verrucomicrobiota bacterium]